MQSICGTEEVRVKHVGTRKEREKINELWLVFRRMGANKPLLAASDHTSQQCGPSSLWPGSCTLTE